MSFYRDLEIKVKEIEAIIETFLPREEGYQKTIFASMNYSLRAGGKRLRPLFLLECYKAFGGQGHEAEPFAAAMEMIHTASLVHDDLPCMDNDELRRGRPTTWKAYGEDMAVLAGDALMMYAFETAAKAFLLTDDKAKVGTAVGILAEKTGIYGMIGGQTVDVELTDKTVTKEELDFIYRLKTGALLEASFMIGSLLGGASPDEVKAMERIAGQIGLAFQIQDDILDVTSSREVLGKEVLSDEKNNKTTYVTLYGIAASKEMVAKLSQQALKGIKDLKRENVFLEALVEMLITRKK